jgi:hypothetical protein
MASREEEGAVETAGVADLDLNDDNGEEEEETMAGDSSRVTLL